MLAIRWRHLSLSVAVLASLVLACEEFTSEPPVAAAIEQAAAWPASLDVGAIANVSINIVDPAGSPLTAVEVSWQTTDSSIVQVSQLAVPSAVRADPSIADLTRTLTAHVAGSAEVIVTVDRSGVVAIADTFPVTVSLAWPSLLTVTQRVPVDLKLLNVDGSNDLGVEWRSTDTGVLRVDSVGPFSAALEARARGSAQVVATLRRPGSAQREIRVPVQVGPLSIVPDSMALTGALVWPDSMTTTLVDTVAVQVLGADGLAVSGLEVEWQSSNTAILDVAKLDTVQAPPGVASSWAEVTARGRGSAELIAVVSRVGFESAEYRQQVRVLQGWIQVSAGGPLFDLFFYPGPSGQVGHTCAITTAGEVYCWGSTDVGQLGIGAGGLFAHVPVPTRVPVDLQFRVISAGGDHTCGLTGSEALGGNVGSVFCWGAGRLVPEIVNEAPRQTWKLSAGGTGFGIGGAIRSFWTCAIDSEEGRFETICFDDPNLPPAVFATDVSVGGSHICVQERCWGDNQVGQLGNGTTTSSDVFVLLGRGFDRLTTGYDHNCGVSTGLLYCWGSNEWGQLGAASASRCTAADEAYNGVQEIACTLRPTPADASPSFASITAGFGFTCGLTSEGVVYCWGKNDVGQLGRGFSSPAETSIEPVTGGRTFTSIDAGFDHTCGVTTDKALFCWGNNWANRLGIGDTQGPTDRPVRVAEPDIRT